ncbi:MAG: hypothetical protein ABIE25_08270 [Thermoplasmatota archaeon]|nr:hypothetical protein [Candidatus Thermoplasmatota archaeon]MBU1914154.1 hypothetical protein [Candidatus Thermoplasmatota archaeon]
MEERLRFLSRAMQAGTVAVAIAGIVTGNLTWVPAAVVALFISFIPSILRRDLKITLPIELNFWIVLALFLHVVGGFSGFYNTIPGWDHLTHMMSASLIGALGFVTVVIVDKYVESIHLPRPFLAFFILMFTMAMGVLWEVMEFADDSLAHTTHQYGLTDTMIDLLFDGFAGFIVAVLGVQYLLRASADHFVDSLHVDEAKDKIVDYLQKRRDSV